MKSIFTSALLMAMVGVASATPVVLMPDTTNNRLVAFSPVDGSVINNNLFTLNAGQTSISAIQVGSEVWVSEQIGDKISRWSWSGAPLGNAGVGNLDNVRGITLIDGVVYAANDGPGFGSTDTLARFDPTGTFLGYYSTAVGNTSPFYVLKHNGNLLTTSSAGNNDVHLFDMTGASAGAFYNGANSFAEQADHATDGSVLIGWFTSNKVSKHDPVTGAELSFFTASGARGVYQLSNGNIMWSNGSGAWVFNTTTGGSTQVYTGGGRFFSLANMPDPTQGVAGTLNLGDTVATFAVNRSISYSVVQGTTTLGSGTITASTSATAMNISLPGTANGAAQLVFDGSSFLRKTVALNLTGANQNIGNVNVQNGDVDNSGEVDAADIDAVIADFGSTTSASTDVDVSGEVDAADIDIVIANFGGVDS